jgi:hypothetical protein
MLQEVARLVQQHFGDSEPFELPLVTKLYVLRSQAAAAPAHAHGSCSSSTNGSSRGISSSSSCTGGGDDESDDEGQSMQALVRKRA